MNARETFLATMAFEKGAHSLKAEFGYWTTTIKRFLAEGLPVVEKIPDSHPDNGTISGAEKVDPGGKELADRNVRPFFGLESFVAKFSCDYSPLFKEKVLEENAEYRVFTDRYGITKKERKTGSSPPLDIEFPISNRRDFEAYKERYGRDFSVRLPKDWKNLSAALRNRDYPMRLGGFPYGFLGFPRHLMGTTGLFFAMYDDPRLVKDINEFFLNLVMAYWAEIIKEVKPDCALIWEDMAYATGSMISEEAFAEFLSPFYRRMVDFLRQHGVTNIHVDSDGYIEGLIPLWVELGVTGLFPMERKAGNDLARIRKRFPRLQLLGGVDKRVLAEGRSEADIDGELEMIREIVKQGGFIPHVDHHVSDDACWKNFRYYRARLNEIIDNTSP
jgi:uroporphyrinogen decarboxylase